MAARLLATDNLLQARYLADVLNSLNRRRQQMTNQFNNLAASQITDIDEAKILFAADEEFVAGIIGLVAGRLKRKLLSAGCCFGSW